VINSDEPQATRPPVDGPGIDAPLADGPLSDALIEAPTTAVAAPDGGPRQSVIRSSMIYSGLTLISRVMGFARDLAISYTMGASATVAADAYNTALMFPNVFRRIFAEGAFASAFVPAYAKSLAKDGEEAADVLAADAMAVLTTATLAIMIIAELGMTYIMYVISPGYAHDPQDPTHIKFGLAVWLTRITMPYLPCMAIYAHLSGVLNARGRFIFSALAPTLLNLVMLAAVLPQKTAIGAATAASWGVLVAGVLQAALLWWGVSRSGGRVDFRWPRLTPEIKALIWLAIPGAFAASATQINILISNVLASQVHGARSWLATADRLYQLPLGLVGVAIGVALLPRLSTAVQSGDGRESQNAMDEAIVFALALTLPAAAALMAMPYFLIDALFVRGEFKLVDAQQTAAALFHYGWGVPAFVLIRILAPAFFARQDTKSPMRFALTSVAVNIVFGIGLFRFVGFQGIAAATAIASWVNVGLMMATLVRRGFYRPSPAAMARLMKLLAASVVLGVLMGLASALRPYYEAQIFHRKEISVVIVSGVSLAIYGMLLMAFRAVTPAELRAALKRSPKSKGAAAGPGVDLL
jgi:putative peptidoglycan lipid II flippase